MFFKPQIKNGIWPILEVGPGSNPHRLSDIWLDYKFKPGDLISQSGGEIPAKGKPIILYKGGKFPFKDKSFQYVIASHVLEHIPWDSVSLFLSELERVASAGYIELPRWTYEMIGDWDVHLLFGDVQESKLNLYKKVMKFDHTKITEQFLELDSFSEFIRTERKLFFCSLEWRGNIPYKLIEPTKDFFQTDKLSEILKNDIYGIKKKNAEGVYKKEKNTNIHRYLNKLNRIYFKRIKQRSRSMSLTTIRGLLQCPFSGSEINKNWENVSGSFKFIKKGMVFTPNDFKGE